MIELKNVTKQFSSRKVVFSNVNDQFKPGEFTGLIGPNGSGKTTFLRLLSVNSFPTSGSVYFDGFDIHKKPSHYLQYVGLVHDEESLPLHLSAVELLEWVLRSRKAWSTDSPKKIDDIYDRLQLLEDRQSAIGTYSTGMRKKTQIAAAFITDPAVLILDEPMRGLDDSTRRVIKEMLLEAKKRNTIILMASHLMNRETEGIDRILDFPLKNE